MKDKAKTKDQLINELTELRRKFAELEVKEAQFKKAEELQGKIGERFDLAVKASQDGLWDWNIKNQDEYWSPQYKNLLGYQDDEIEPNLEKWESMLHPDDRKYVMELMRNYLEKPSNTIIEAEFRLKTKSGAYRWYSSRGQGVWDKNGKAIRMVGSTRDITDFKQLELELKKAYQNLEEKVAKRTTELRAVNKELKKTISKQKKIESELRQTTSFLDNLIESSLDCLVVADISGYLIRVNKYFLKLLGYEREEEVIGKHIADFGPKKDTNYELATGEKVKLDDEYFEGRKEMYNKLLEERRVSNWQNYLVTKGGKLVPVEHNVSFLYSEKGDPIATIGIARDITERKLAEKELKDAKEFLENTFRTSLEGIVVIDPQGYITMANDTFFTMLGYQEEELIGENMTLLRPGGEGHLQKTREFLDAFVGNEYAKEFELTWKRKDGTLIDVELNAALVKDEQGTFVWGVGSVRDITARKLAEKALRNSEEKYYSLIEHANDAIISINGEGIVMGFNRSAEEMFGWSREEILGKSSELLVSKQNRGKQREELKKLKETGSAFDSDQKILEGTGIRKDGEEFPLEFSFYVIETGGEVIATSSIRDVSKRKMVEKKLFDYQNRLKALTSQLTLSEEKERRRFAEYLHDEIGQYLFASQIQLEQLKAFQVSKKNKEVLDSIIKNIKHMIDKSRSLTFELSSPVLHELGLEKALEWLAEHIYKQYNIRVDLKDDREEKKLNDDMKIFLYQAVRELLTNVAKHAQVKNAIVSIKKDNAGLQISVEDKGVGFNSLSADSREGHNKGFGLFRINERVEQFGGQLKVESQPNRGTIITLVVPLSTT